MPLGPRSHGGPAKEGHGRPLAFPSCALGQRMFERDEVDPLPEGWVGMMPG